MVWQSELLIFEFEYEQSRSSGSRVTAEKVVFFWETFFTYANYSNFVIDFNHFLSLPQRLPILWDLKNRISYGPTLAIFYAFLLEP